MSWQNLCTSIHQPVFIVFVAVDGVAVNFEFCHFECGSFQRVDCLSSLRAKLNRVRCRRHTVDWVGENRKLTVFMLEKKWITWFTLAASHFDARKTNRWSATTRHWPPATGLHQTEVKLVSELSHSNALNGCSQQRQLTQWLCLVATNRRSTLNYVRSSTEPFGCVSTRWHCLVMKFVWICSEIIGLLSRSGTQCMQCRMCGGYVCHCRSFLHYVADFMCSYRNRWINQRC